MNDIIAQRVLASVPKSSTGVVSMDQKNKLDLNEKGKGGEQNSLLRSASQLNRVAVVIAKETPLDEYVYSEQDTRQVYVTGSKSDANGNVYEVQLARYKEGEYAANDPDGSKIVALGWVDVKYITALGKLADATIVVEGSQPVQTDPAVELLSSENDNRMLESFIFFDHFRNGTEKSDLISACLESAIGLQREVAKFMNLYSGKSAISDEQQKKIDTHIHLVPFSDISREFTEKYPLFSAHPNPGINASLENFLEYWNTNVSNKKIHIIIIFNHANQNGICLRANGKPMLLIDDLINLQMPKIDYILALGCNLGNTSYETNFASAMAALTQGSNPVEQPQSFFDRISGREKEFKNYQTAVVAADGNTSAPVTFTDGFITGIMYNNGKYAAHDNHQYKHYIKGDGFCVYVKNVDTPTPIPGTQTIPNVDGSDENWTEQPISVETMLIEAKKIVQV